VAIWEREMDPASLRAKLAGAFSMPVSEAVAEPSLAASGTGM
jgi:hypothetical protein